MIPKPELFGDLGDSFTFHHNLVGPFPVGSGRYDLALARVGTES